MLERERRRDGEIERKKYMEREMEKQSLVQRPDGITHQWVLGGKMSAWEGRK